MLRPLLSLLSIRTDVRLHFRARKGSGVGDGLQKKYMFGVRN